jgi:hypothetical protein
VRKGPADALLMRAHEKSRRKLFRRHLAQRRHLYAKAVSQGDVRAALACLDSEAVMLGLRDAETERRIRALEQLLLGKKGGQTCRSTAG